MVRAEELRDGMLCWENYGRVEITKVAVMLYDGLYERTEDSVWIKEIDTGCEALVGLEYLYPTEELAVEAAIYGLASDLQATCERRAAIERENPDRFCLRPEFVTELERIKRGCGDGVVHDGEQNK